MQGKRRGGPGEFSEVAQRRTVACLRARKRAVIASIAPDEQRRKLRRGCKLSVAEESDPRKWRNLQIVHCDEGEEDIQRLNMPGECTGGKGVGKQRRERRTRENDGYEREEARVDDKVECLWDQEPSASASSTYMQTDYSLVDRKTKVGRGFTPTSAAWAMQAQGRSMTGIATMHA